MTNRKFLSLVVLLILAAPLSVWAQLSTRQTPFGTQKPMPAEKPVAKPEPKGKAEPREKVPKAPESAPEKLDVVLDRAISNAGGKQAIRAITDSVATGSITWFDASGKSASFPVTLSRKGDAMVQMVVRQPAGDVTLGTDGKTAWNTWNGFSVDVSGGQALSFLESQSSRSVKNLVDADGKGAIVRDKGLRKNKDSTKADARLVEVEEKSGRKTSFLIDSGNSNIVGVAFQVGEQRSPFGGPPIPKMETFIFDDFRAVRGVQTPHKIQHFLGGLKVEELQFDNVRHNVSVPDNVFHK